MKKLLKLFIVGIIIAIVSVLIAFSRPMTPETFIFAIPMGVGLALAALACSIALKKWVRGLERD